MTNVLEHEIQVSGNKMFSAFEWKNAIDYYLEGVRTDDWAVMYRPKIFFGGVTLRRENTHYQVYHVVGSPDHELPDVQGPPTLVVTCENELVEDALRRFSENEQVKVLSISFLDGAALFLWKKEDGTYGALAKDAASLLPN